MNIAVERTGEDLAHDGLERTESALMAGSLTGRGIVVTRPAAQSASLAAAISEAGGTPILFPTIEICDTADPTALDIALSRVAHYDWAFFVSPNAVEKVFARKMPWPGAIRVAAIGPGTVAALQRHGVSEVVMPQDRFDSEGLLALPEFAVMRGVHCVVFRGNGGRELIATTLTARGATVDLVECYRRTVPTNAAAETASLLVRWSRGEIDAVTFTSSEGARNFSALMGDTARASFTATPAFVPHARIADTARQIGFTDVVETGQADAGLLAALCERFGRGRSA